MSTAPRVVALAGLVLAGAATAGERAFPVDGFDRIVNETSADLAITVGSDTQVIGRGDDALLGRLELRVEGGTLRIRSRSGRDGEARLTIAMPVLVGLTLSSSGDAQVESLKAERFEGQTTGSGNLDLGWLEAASASLRTSGSGDIVARGQVGQLMAGSTGSGDLQLSQLQSTVLEASSTGSGDILANATGTARLRSTGSGDIAITGGARCEVRSSGSGDVMCGPGAATSG